MNRAELENLLRDLQRGDLSIDEGVDRLAAFPEADLGFARLDIQRELRRGQPEFVLGEGKSVEQIVAILKEFRKHTPIAAATRITPEQWSQIQPDLPDAQYFPKARILLCGPGRGRPVDVQPDGSQPDSYQPGSSQPSGSQSDDAGFIAILSGGSSDEPVAEEAAVTAEILGHSVERFYDCGVAGLHRLLRRLPRLREARVVIAVAGMEGALPGVASGLLAVPVIAVPASTGYGASFGGLSALLTMLNSCSPGVSVVNIDNGFGAACIAGMINRPVQRSAGASDSRP